MFVSHYHGSVVQWVLVGYQSDHKEIHLEKKNSHHYLYFKLSIPTRFSARFNETSLGRLTANPLPASTA